jgi:hypothetical protein
MDWHAWTGDALLTLLLFRLLWGFLGSDTALFARFLASPSAARQLAVVFRREPDLRAGHNPAGSWMVLVLIALLLGETLTGLYVDNDIANEGPFTELLPTRIANMINALHDTISVGRAAGERRAAHAGNSRVCVGKAAQPTAAHDHRPKDVARKRARATRSACGPRTSPAGLQRRRYSRACQFPVTRAQPLGGTT